MAGTELALSAGEKKDLEMGNVGIYCLDENHNASSHIGSTASDAKDLEKGDVESSGSQE